MSVQGVEGRVSFRRAMRRVDARPLTDFEADHPGHPLGVGMPLGATLRDDGQTHREAWAAITRRDPCAYCGRASGTMDHIEPQARAARGLGGRYSWLNFTGACSTCNTGKSDMPLLEYLYRRRWSAPVKHRKAA